MIRDRYSKRGVVDKKTSRDMIAQNAIITVGIIVISFRPNIFANSVFRANQ